MLTSNDKWRVDSHMRNRPGRIFYMIDFKGLDEAFIREYCLENLTKPEPKIVDTVVNISSVFAAFNFDMLKALIEEMNRYGETPQEAMRILNVKAEFDAGAAYHVEIFKGDRTATRISPSTWNGTPLSAREICISWRFERKKKSGAVEETAVLSPVEDDEDDGWGEEDFGQEDLVKFNNKTGQFIFEKDGVTMILTKERPKYFNFDAF
jgi:hypothetical protein